MTALTDGDSSASIVISAGRDNLKKNRKMQKAMAVFFAEFLGTATLMFVGCMGCAPQVFGRDTFASPQLPSLSFGLTIILCAQMFGHISGAHINPSVTIAAWIMKEIKFFLVPVYFLAQFLGALVGFGLLMIALPKALLPSEGGICNTVPHKELSVYQALLIEFVATSFIVVSLCAVWDKRNAKNTDSVPARIGLLLAGLFMVAAPYTGCSINTARSLAPAIYNNVWKDHWVYWVAPNVSAAVSSSLYWFFCVHLGSKDPSSKIKDAKTLNYPTLNSHQVSVDVPSTKHES